MGRYRWQSCSHHSDSEWASFGRYRMRMVHGMDHILLHFHKFFLFLTTQSSGQKNENKVPGCVQLWLGHAEVILEPWETDMLWISEVLLSLATYRWVKKIMCYLFHTETVTVLLVSDKLVRNRSTVRKPPSLLCFSYEKIDTALASRLEDIVPMA